MPHFAKKGASYKFHPRPQKPDTEYAKTLRAKLQRKLEALTEPPQKVTTLAEMSPEKQAAIKALYESRENKR